MGMIERVFTLLFGGGRNVLRETAEVFTENSDQGAERVLLMHERALAQHGAEFQARQMGWFDRFMDGVNRLPRPALALGTLFLFVSAMVDPLWFAARMQGLALVPEPLWWLLGAVVSFYFGARHQAKGQEFQHSLAQTLARAPAVARQIALLNRARDARDEQDNAALSDWRGDR